MQGRMVHCKFETLALAVVILVVLGVVVAAAIVVVVVVVVLFMVLVVWPWGSSGGRSDCADCFAMYLLCDVSLIWGMRLA